MFQPVDEAKDLVTFVVPDVIDGKASDIELAKKMLAAWAADGIFQVARTSEQDEITEIALNSSRKFFAEPMDFKSKCVSDLTFAGYIASGEEVTAGEKDFSEIFTICKDVPESDPRVTEKWPCHGPVPWPSTEYAENLTAMTNMLGNIGDRLLQLVALGLGMEMDSLKNLARDGWHHARVLRFATEQSKRSTRGIGAHTDYGLLVIAAQDDVGGLYVRPPIEGEPRNRNWLPAESSAGMYADIGPWNYVKPMPSVLTVFPGDIFQLITDGMLLSTPHKVKLNTRERYAIAYFHEPNFRAVARSGKHPEDYIHYGTHFTNMFLRCYPDRITTARIEEEQRLDILASLRGDDLIATHY